MTYLEKITKIILKTTSHKGLPKVRLAKYIYLSHKRLVNDELVGNKDLKFIRMPLGPVPVGFKELKGKAFVEVTVDSVGLSYNREKYSLKDSEIPIDGTGIFTAVKEVVNVLDKLRTSTIIEYTHKEKGWKDHKNGEEFYIDEEDLKRRNPKDDNSEKNASAEEMQIQSLLIEGNIEEIASENTALEYPELLNGK